MQNMQRSGAFQNQIQPFDAILQTALQIEMGQLGQQLTINTGPIGQYQLTSQPGA